MCIRDRKKNNQQQTNETERILASDVEPDERGMCEFYININDKPRVKILIPFRCKVRDIFDLFDPKDEISWVTHSIVVNDTTLWYDNYLYLYENILTKDIAAKIEEDKGETLFEIISFFFGKYFTYYYKKFRAKFQKKEQEPEEIDSES